MVFLWLCSGCGGGVFSFSEARISTAGRGRTIGHYKDYPDADDELQAGSLVFRQGQVEKERVRRMIHGPPNGALIKTTPIGNNGLIRPY